MSPAWSLERKLERAAAAAEAEAVAGGAVWVRVVCRREAARLGGTWVSPRAMWARNEVETAHNLSRPGPSLAIMATTDS
jgi:hypothetical protein